MSTGSISSLKKCVHCRYEGIMVAVAHDAFKYLDLNKIKGKDCVMYDVKNFIPDANVSL